MSSITKAFKSLNGVKRTFGSLKTKSFEDTIIALNSLQPNSAELSQSIKLKQQQKHDEANYNLRETEKFLCRIDGFKKEKFEKLSIIHVSGSKGKGSTCTFTEAILREHNVKTGLFTSPHLVTVTERIKLNSKPINKRLFCEYFWEVFDALHRKKDSEFDLPSYFKFLQIMAFYIFIRENVECAIVEVGIGGEFDSTNIIKHTEIVGITALQLEHTQLLGETLEEIAWQKAGIIKANSHVRTMTQPEICMKVITERFEERKGKSLSVTPEFSSYNWLASIPDFSQTSEVNKLNFSLAIQLSAQWLKARRKISKEFFVDDCLHSIDAKFVDAFNKCQFEGRFQRIEQNGVTFFLDGAHTKESMEICVDWFAGQIQQMKDCINILIFNVTGDRDSAAILSSLNSKNFHYVCFTTNIATPQADNGKCENFNGLMKDTYQLERCLLHKDIWQKMKKSSDIESQLSVCPTIQHALEIINDIKNNNVAHLNVLVTGSLHLIGSALVLLKKSGTTEEEEKCLNTKRMRSSVGE